MKKYRNGENWSWYQFEKDEISDIKQLIANDTCSNSEWLKKVPKNKINLLKIEILEGGEKIVKGSLIYKQSFEDELDYEIFHFYLTKERLITVDLNLSVFKYINADSIFEQMDRTENALDGFLIFIGELMNEMLYGIDQYEEALKKLIWTMHKKNDISILDKIYKSRHELLLWKNILIPIKELKMTIEEVYLSEVTEGEIFIRTCKRIERAIALLNEYEHEIDSIIKLEEIISSHRGNEIMKTLTVITTVFTPVMALGALWGMNFRNMPELEWKYGYLFSILLIIASTILIYWFMHVKGWTGDLLKGRKKGSFFK
ncbi:magnesium transporter CorA family protein [Metabacillus fastidiosus]|uniref:magnesium transporter CorA family protein n=1 Tax=Metabacillus fastidiosus TaxID=1458 RepID=UPI002DB60410|nr:magnesium transporter CorA family protein [Metabacillus fastidiosus]MEC2078027.1 magnesium transporter CorA family protein [Metabacillus fastidiosus]